MASIRQLYRRLRYGAPIVVVSGLPRSGTSMAMKMLEAGGLHPIQDGIRTADEDNPKGYYEDERVKDLHIDEDKSWLSNSRGKAIKIISFLLTHLPEDHNYKIVFMRRHLDEVLASQVKMLDRRGEDNETTDEQMRKVYETHLWQVNRLVKRKSCFDVLDVSYREALDQPRQIAQQIRTFLDLPLDVDAMTGVVDKSLYRNRAQS